MCSSDLIDFINELSTWYVRRSRERLKGEGEDKEICAQVLRHVLLNLVKLAAPFMPFMSERFWGRLQKDLESVHLADWPECQEKMIDWKILKEMQLVRNIVELGLAARADKNLKVRQHLRELKVANLVLAPELTAIIAEELNVKQVTAVKNLDKETADARFVVKEEGVLKVGLDVEMDEELKNAGLLRELVRTINQMRKNEGLTINDKVAINFSSSDEKILALIAKEKESLARQVLAKEIVITRESEGGKEVEVGGIKLQIKFN